MEFLRTEQIWLVPDDIISGLCHLSKNLWNEANYIVRQEFFRTGKWTRYNTLAGMLKVSENFRELPAATAQQVLRVLDRSWNSFFKACKEWSKNPGKFLGRPKMPGYKQKCGEFVLILTNQQVRIEGGYVVFPKKLDMKVKTRLGDDTNIREIRIIPKGTGYVLEIVYKKKVESLNLDPSRVAGIDFGVRNIVTMANNIGEPPIVIKGGAVKSINQYYNKRRAGLLSTYDRHGIRTGKALQKLTGQRNRKIRDAMHKISRYLINWCIDHNIGTIVIGYNETWKQHADIGRRNNQNFVSIPHYLLAHDIEYKGEEVGIAVKSQEESHTSKCSFLDCEPVEHRNRYAGKRISRGLFRSGKGILMNADVNGALNIIRKAIPEAFKADGIEGVGLHPERVSFKEVCLTVIITINRYKNVTTITEPQ